MKGFYEGGNEPLTLYNPDYFLSNTELFAPEEELCYV
jgi:hypothetical protein